MTHMRPNPGPYVPGSFDDAAEDVGNSSAVTTSTDASATSVTPNSTTPTPGPAYLQFPCQWILCAEIKDSRVRIWDVIILIPNALFLLFLLLQLKKTVAKLQRTSSPIFFAFYGLVFTVAVISVLRCVVSMTVNAAVPAGDITDKVLWLVLRFALLATELSVVVFGLAFGHLDSRTSIQRVVIVTFTVALVYSIVQGVLEFKYPDTKFHIIVDEGDREYDLFAHGGMLFWFASSIFFFVIYTVICILPWTPLRHRFAMPSKKSFYVYCSFLSLLNLTQAVGSGLLYYGIKQGLCICDVSAFIYFTLFAPLVYFTFLRDFFKTSQPSILFSYKAQLDEEEDTVSLPHQTYAPTKQDSDSFDSDLVNSTHFDQMSPNPLYETDIPQIGVNSELSINTDYYREDEEYHPRPMIT